MTAKCLDAHRAERSSPRSQVWKVSGNVGIAKLFADGRTITTWPELERPFWQCSLAKAESVVASVALCCLGVSPGSNEDIKHVAVCVDGTPHPMFLAADRDNDFIQMPLVVGPWTVLADALCEVSTTAADPQPDGFAADDDAVLSAKRWYVQTA